jgi:protein SCO1
MNMLTSLSIKNLVLIFALLIGSIIFSLESAPPVVAGPSFPEELSDVILPNHKTLQPFALYDHNREAFNLDSLKGKWTFLFFGYTHCPDVCPMALAMLADLFEILDKDAPQAMEKTHGVFVSVDPLRDTPEDLQQYAPYFHPEFLGVTGSEKAIKAFTRQIGALYFFETDFKDPNGKKQVNKDPNGKKQIKKPDPEEGYSVSHTSAFFLIDPLGRLVAIFPDFNNTDSLFEEYVRIRKFVKIRNLYGNSEGLSIDTK